MNARAILACVLIYDLSAAACAQERGESWSIIVMDRDGSNVRRVIYIETFPTLAAPRWSHDGRRLAFEAHGNRPTRALLVDTNGRNLINLGAGAQPDWSPDDKQVLFEVPAVGRTSVWVQNTSGKGSSWLAAGSAPRWSPDASQIAIGAPLRLFDVVTGQQENVFTDKDGVEATLGCDWSPDGSRLAVNVRRAGRRELILVAADPKSRTPRARLQADLIGAPNFSPDGKQLAVTIHDRKQRALRIYVLDVDGDAPPVPVPAQQGDNRDPTYSPDGKQIAFASTRIP